MYFNPRAHEGRDYNLERFYKIAWDISIHAPMRGATVFILFLLFDKTISIHAPMRGATIINAYKAKTGKNISIHAPMRGATYSSV